MPKRTHYLLLFSLLVVACAPALAQQEDIAFVVGGHSAPINQMVLSPDGRNIATASDDSTVRIWDVGRGTLLRILRGHRGAVRTIAFSPDGLSLASGSADSTVRIWSMTAADTGKALTGYSGGIGSIVWLEQQIIAGSSDGMISIRSWETGSQSASFRAFDGSVTRVLATADSGLIIALGPDAEPWYGVSGDSVKVWSASGDSLLHSFHTGSYGISTIAFSQDSSLLAVAENDRILLLDPWQAQRLDTLYVDGSIHDMVFIDNGSRLALLDPVSIRVVDLESDSVVNSVRFETESGTWLESGDLELLPGGERFLIAGSVRRGGPMDFIIAPVIDIHSVATGERLREIQGHRSPVESMQFRRDGLILVSGSREQRISIHAQEVQVKLRADQCTGIAISPNGEFCATGYFDNDLSGSGRVLFQTSDGRGIGSVYNPGGHISAVAMAPGGRSALYSTYGTHHIWDSSTNRSAPHRNRGRIYSFDGQRLAGVTGDTIGVWGLFDSIPLISLPAGSPVSSLAFSRDGSLLVSGHADGRIFVWDLNAQRELSNFGSHSEAVSAVTFSRNGRYIVSAGLDSTVRIWSVATGALEYTYDDYPSALLSVSISADSKYIASGAVDGSVIIWFARGEVSGVEWEVVPLKLDLSEKVGP